jgi:agmatine/peptidylarginine deiminase
VTVAPFLAAPDAQGRALEFVEIPVMSDTLVGAERVAAQYLNLYVADGGVLAYSGGVIHCITQPVPHVRAAL